MMEQTGVRRLLRSLSLGDLSVLASSSMAPAYSIAVVMGLLVVVAGVGAPLAVIVSTIPVAFVAIGFGRLAITAPAAGGAYSWSKIAFGDRAGWFTAVLVIVAYYFGTLACAVPAAVYTISALGLLHVPVAATSLAVAIAGLFWTAFSTYFLFIGARPTARVSAIFLFVEIAALLVVAVDALVQPFSGTAPPAQVPIGIAIGATGVVGIVVGAVLSFWLSAGWEITTYSSEESTGSAATPGVAALIGLLCTMALVWFCMVAFLHVGTVNGFDKHQDDALAYVAQRLGGGWIADLMVANVLVSSAAALWTTMQVLSRAVFAMGRDGLLPRALASVHPRYGSPWVAILVVSVPVAVLLLYSGLVSSAQQTLTTVVNGSSIFVGATFTITGFACAWLQARQPQGQHHAVTGVVLPVIGALWMLAFLIYDVLTQQTPFIRWLSVAGVVVAFIFAMTAGRWATSDRAVTSRMSYQTVAPAKKEEA